jgi:sugar O-acyltransferase (sialic acid O-acetyltransferase NeuD family)
MAKLILFGTGDIAQLACYYFTNDTEHEVVAFTVDEMYITDALFERRPVVPFEKIEVLYPPAEYSMFIALSYAKLNTIRQQKYIAAKAKGYNLESYISSRCSYLPVNPPGDNCFILEDNTIQPFVSIGNNVTLWSGNHIGHHSVIDSHNFISSHVVVSGHCIIKQNCFIGVNATIGHKVTINEKCIIGAGAVVTSNTKAGAVYVPAKSAMLDIDSSKINL